MLSALSFALLAAPLLARAETHMVDVGASGLTFTPEALSAAVGDTVLFTFKAKNHTATQSSFASPCGPMAGGFDSGFMPVANGTTDFPTFSYTVQATTPTWVYCKQAANTPASHCGAGMVFAINCPTNSSAPNSFSNFKASALAIGQQLAAAAASAGAAAPSAAAGYPAPSTPTAGSSTDTPTTGSSTDTSTGTGSGAGDIASSGQVHVIAVGGNSALTFEPTTVAAQPGDVISFQFMSKNHSATQSSFASPCTKIASTTTTPGFDSGFMFVGNSTTPLIWNVTVNDTTPIWVYCRQKTPADHCGAGMVFAVNSNETAGSTKTFSAFQAAAKAQEVNANTTSNGTSSTSAPGASGSSGATRQVAGLGLGLAGAVFALFL